MNKKTLKIREQILRDVIHHPTDLVSHISEIFGISRQAVNKHVNALAKDGWLAASGTTRNKLYSLGHQRRKTQIFKITEALSEHNLFVTHYSLLVDDLPKNIQDIIFYGFTEMVNNAKDHSEGELVKIDMHRTKEKTVIMIHDNGKEGIFTRIKRLKNLADERQSLIELSKGKLTTDPDNHSGQGIFFTSKMFDSFGIFSGELVFGHRSDAEYDVIVDGQEQSVGTIVFMSIENNSTRIDKEVFAQFTSGDDFAFDKTIIPVSLAKFGNENLVSRSQAKRLLTRIENFKLVLFDFQGVDAIGQAFADEIFRVYKNTNPQIKLAYINASQDVEKWIMRAMSL